MGYSARYHAYSLIAVFVALAIGLVIGAGFGQDVVSSTSESLQNSLEGDLQDARAERDAIAGELDQERQFSDAVYPALVDGRLDGDRVGVIALGGIPQDVSDDVQDALGPTGATLAEVAVVREPPDVDGLADQLQGTRFARVDRDPQALEDLARIAGRELVNG